MKFRAAVAWSVPLFVSAALVNCTSASTEPHYEECDEIASLCHPAEDISEEAAACHEQAHDGDLDLCLEIHDDCVALCEEILGVGGAGGGGGAGGATGH